jgi:sugar lactone lactonase YvrE
MESQASQLLPFPPSERSPDGGLDAPRLPEPRPGARPWREWTTIAALLALALLHVHERRVSLVSLAAWLGALGLAVQVCTRGERRRVRLSCRRLDVVILALALFASLDRLWAFASVPGHYHIDEFITAYTSYSLPDVVRLDWFADFPDVWVCRFPVLFHALQKPFFQVLGPSLETLRISTWPYFISTAGYAFALGSLVFSRRAGLAAGIVCLFLGAQLYLSSMGLHFHSSTCFYVAAVYHFLAALASRSRRQAALAGAFTGSAYLTYAGSYVAAPVLAVIAAAEVLGTLRHWRLRLVGEAPPRRSALPTLAVWAVIFGIVVAPFFLYAVTVRNFLFERVGQVNVLTGTWVRDTQESGPPPDPVDVVRRQAWDTLRSFVTPDLGGTIGYTFGHQALLDRATAVCAGLGLAVCLWRVLRRRERGAFGLLVALAVPVVVNAVLTQHPVPFHRMCVAFPVLAVLVACPIGLAADRVSSRWPRGGAALMTVALGGLVYVNVSHARAMVEADSAAPDGPALAAWCKSNLLTGDTLYVGAPWAMHVAPELLFRTNGRFRIIADDIDRLVPKYAGDGPLVLFNPSSSALAALVAHFPSYEIRYELDGAALQNASLFLSRRDPLAALPAAVPTAGAPAPTSGRSMFEGGCGTGPGEFRSPRAIAVARNGDVYVADSENQRIERFSARGRYRGSFGGPGKGPVQFNLPSGLAFDGDSNLYVSDGWNHRIQKLTKSGGFLAEWQPELFAPFGLTFTPGGELLIANTGKGRIVRLSAEGAVLGGFGERGHDAGQLWDVTSTAVLGDSVYVADPANARIAVFGLGGERRGEWPIAEWRTPSWRWAHVVADPERRRLYVSVPAESEVLILGPYGRRVGTVPAKDAQGQLLVDATAMALAPDKKALYVVDSMGCRVGRAALP